MRSMSKRQNAGEYNNGLPLMSSNPACYRTGSLLHSSFTIPFPAVYSLQSTGFRSILPDKNQSSCQNTRTRGTIFQLVGGLHNPRSLGSLKRVAPLRLSPCYGAPLLDVANLYVPHRIEPRPPAEQDKNIRRVVELPYGQPKQVWREPWCDRMDGAGERLALDDNIAGDFAARAEGL